MPADERTTADGQLRRRLALDGSRFAIIDGVEVHHVVAGDGAPTFVLLHHFYGNVFTWRRTIARLREHGTVVALDRPGFGLTQRLPRSQWNGRNPYTRAAAAALTRGLLDHLGVERAVLVGSSSGGTVALETYARHPDRVEGLVLISPAITGDVGPPASLRPVLAAPGLRQLAIPLVRRLSGEITLQRVSDGWADPSRADETDVDAYTRPLGDPRWPQALWELFTAEAPPALRGLLRRIRVPTVVISGTEDRTISVRASQQTAAAIPDAGFVAIDRCGHTPQEECPDELVAAIVDFLATHPELRDR